jgi:hypothetical protein
MSGGFWPSYYFDVDDRKFIVVETESGIGVSPKRVLEHENATGLKGAAPRLEGSSVAGPLVLLSKGNAEVLAHAHGHARDGNIVGKAKIAGDEPGGRITPLCQFGQIDL